MLNRIYIVVGTLAILVLAGAFILPRFVQWGDYRDRMEVLATTVLGADVNIRGGIEFSLLPQPRLRFSDVVVGSTEAPAATVAEVEAEFALFDFLRDNYTVTALKLVRPVIDLVIDENGFLGSGVDLADAGAGVALGQARIEDATIRLEDVRSDQKYAATNVTGDLRLSSFSGPFQFQGFASHEAGRFDVRFNSAALDAEGNTRIAAFLRETGGTYSITSEGVFTAGVAPRFDGTLTYRHAPPAGEAADDIRGDLVLESNLTASTDRVVISGYTLHPDENRAGMRLTGTASIQLGNRSAFDAVISGGVFSLPPRDATEVPAELPYELVRLLDELPAPPMPPIPGRIGIELAEVGLRGFSLRDVRAQATTEEGGWRLEQAVARLPGDGELRLSGMISNEEGVPGFRGDLSVSASRLDALAQLWRRAGEDNPLFNMAASLSGRVTLGGDALGLNNGQLNIAGQSHGLELRIGFGEEPRLDTVVHLANADASHMAALMALLPADVGQPGSFGVSFPNGSFSLSAQSADVMGIAAQDLVAEGQWSPEAVRFSRLVASDWGGLGLNGSLRLSGAPAAPHVTASGRLTVASADSEGLVAVQELLGVPFAWQEAMANVWPADLQFILTDAEDADGQTLTLAGTLGGAALDVRAEMAGGLEDLAEGGLRLIGSLEGSDFLQDRFGIGTSPVFGDSEEAMLASVFLEGSVAEGLNGRVAVNQGDHSLSYLGTLDFADSGELSGEGTLEALLPAANGLPGLAGLEGVGLGDLDATAVIRFDATRSLELIEIAGTSGGTDFSGNLAMQRVGQMPSYEGSLVTASIDTAALMPALFGAEALIPGTGLVPEGPLATDGIANSSRGRIAIRTDALTAGGAEAFGATGFNYFWDPQSVGIDRFSAAVGGGTLGLSVSRCCAGSLPERTLSGQVTLAGVDLGAIVPGPVAGGLSGRLDAGLQFDGTGASLADAVRAMTGEGNFTIADFAATGLSPAVFPSIAGFGDVLNMDADALETLIALSLGQDSFKADSAQGTFTIVSGTARIANLIIAGQGARLAGGLNLVLETLGLDGSFVLTALDFSDDSGLVEPDSARIVARIAGTLFAPVVTRDLSEIVASIQVRANELELDRLEVLRLEDEARQREAAQERNRLIEEQRRRAAEEEAARLAAEEEARRLEEERLRQELQQQQEQQLPIQPNQPVAPLDLGFQPGVNQPFGPGVNQPLTLE